MCGFSQVFEEFMSQTLETWNVPGAAVCVVAGDEVLWQQGVGYRDWGTKQPFTARTLFPIASNTKLFTAIAAGLLVEEGKLTWDEPIREKVPQIRFSTDALNNAVTLRDMLAHRTGIHRHDSVWNKSNFTPAEIFDRLRQLRPAESLRQTFMYNNLMYAAVGHVIELVSGQSWASFVRDRLLVPAGMGRTIFSHAEFLASEDRVVPHIEKRDSDELMRLPDEDQLSGATAAGGMVSTLEDMSIWLRVLMNNGRLGDRQIAPQQVLQETLAPAVALPNSLAMTRGWHEILNATYGMGRHTAVYRGRLIAYHGGLLDGVTSQVMLLPHERIGVVTFVVGDSLGALRDTIAYRAIELLLGLDPTPWHGRWLSVKKTLRSAMTQARARAGTERIAGTHPSHSLSDYVGCFRHAAYGDLLISESSDGLRLAFRAVDLPLQHVHYDRFDTPDDELRGKWSVTFVTDPLGDISAVRMVLDQAEAEFVRLAQAPTADALRDLTGTYQTVSGAKWQVLMKNGARLYLCFPGVTDAELVPYKPSRFRIPQFPDRLYTFGSDEDGTSQLRITGPEGRYLLTRIEGFPEAC